MALSAYSAVAQERPNIVLFLVDDMGWQDTSVPFYKERTPYNNTYHTPNMERLAARGIKFTNAYACTVSSPSRVSLMTGSDATRHRVTNWTLYKNKSTDDKNNKLDMPLWNVNGLQTVDTIPNSYVATTLPQLLKGQGYTTMMVGKAHFGAMDTPTANPINMGFDYNIAGHAAGGPGSYLGEKNYGNAQKGSYTPPWGVPNLEEYHQTDTFLTEALTLEACKLIDTALNAQKPFFLYMSHYAVHIPFAEDRRYYQKYIDKGLPHQEAMYAAIVEGMDKSLGDIMDKLESQNILDNTIIIFMSDNGGLSASSRDGKKDTHNSPLRSGKGSAYEGGIREPMIVAWPGKTAPGSKTDDRVVITDFFPTILEMAGSSKAAHTIQHIDGKSFVATLCGKTSNPNRTLYFHYPNTWGATGQGIGSSSTIIDGSYKYIYFYDDAHEELYNIREDIGESTDLSKKSEYAQKTTQMAKKLTKYLINCNAQLPSIKGENKMCSYPYSK